LARLLARYPRLAWYAGRLGRTVRVGGVRLTMPSRYMAGLLRLGGYERAERYAIRFLPRDVPVIELGGGVGVVACLVERRLQHGTRHVVVEASPIALRHLRHNRDQNGATFVIEEAAVADVETVTFSADPEIVSGHVGGDVIVRGVTLSHLLTSYCPDGPFSLVCDIEGAEVAMLLNTPAEALRRIHAVVIETHPHLVDREANAAMHRRLTDAGLQSVWRAGDVYAFQRSQ
jgi:FkbM family methyltransferase